MTDDKVRGLISECGNVNGFDILVAQGLNELLALRELLKDLFKTIDDKSISPFEQLDQTEKILGQLEERIKEER